MRVLMDVCKPALDKGDKVRAELEIHNTDRTAGTITGSALTKKWGGAGLPDDTIHIHFHGSAGQSFAAFCPRGMTFHLEGDANDYFGKGLSGAKLAVFPPKASKFVAEENIIIGNVAFYGATSGEAFVRGIAGERFCVRNSGVETVVEGVGDHGCEYMTGGRVIVIGPTGRNFAAGMSGGLAFVLDEEGDFNVRCNHEMVDVEPFEEPEDLEYVRAMLSKHREITGSEVADRILADWDAYAAKFVKIFPKDLKRVMREAAEREAEKEGVGA
jgi:glutamate synthase (ferredoxin)